MKDVRRILVGLDLGASGRELSPGSRRAADLALWVAKHSGSRVQLVHSSAADETFDPIGRQFVVVHAGTSPEGVEALEALASEFRQEGLKTELAIDEQPAAAALLARAASSASDLVVLGKRTTVERDARRLGSLSRRMVVECPCNVWVVRPDETAEPEKVLAAAELDLVGQRVLEAAAWVARAAKAELHVLHTLQETLDVQLDPQRKKRERELVARAEDELRQRLAAIDAEADVHFHVGIDAPTHAILQAEQRFHPDLVVLGTNSQPGLTRWLGSTAARLVDHLEASILAVKPPAS